MELLLITPNPRWWPFAILEISYGDISGVGHPINFVLDSRPSGL